MTSSFFANKLSKVNTKSNNQGLLNRIMNYFKTPISGNQNSRQGRIRTSTVLLDYIPIEQELNVETLRLSGPYSMFGQGRTIETVSNTTSLNQRTTEYIITYSKTSMPFPFVK